MSIAARKPRFERQVASDRREALVDAAIESLKRYGHEGLSVRRIAAEAGVSIGLINHHFPNKDTLVAESYRAFGRRLSDSFEAAVRAAPAAPARAAARLFQRGVLATEPRPAGADGLGRVLGTPAGVARDAHGPRRGGPRLRRPARTAALETSRASAASRKPDLRLAIIGLTALLDGLWLEWCLDPGSFRPKEAAMLCDDWVDRVIGPKTAP